MATSDNPTFEQAARDLMTVGNAFIPTDAGTLGTSVSGYSYRDIERPPAYLTNREKYEWTWRKAQTTTNTTSPFFEWETDPDAYEMDQLCMFEEDDSWPQKRSRLMEWLDQRSDVSSTTGVEPGTTHFPRW